MPSVLFRMGRANIQTEQTMHDRRRKAAKSGPPLRILVATSALLISLSATHASAQNAEGWVWTLYAEGASPVLAQEIPDTPQLKTTLECDSASKSVRVVVHGDNALTGGAVTLKSDSHSFAGEMRAEHASRHTTIRLDHPVFISFTASGILKLEQAAGSVDVTVERPYLNILRRFARLCAA